tara:strand:+ start:392 stop:580 length:189 start_codon:yes stop_codon:yes gene_type:complete
MNSTVSIGSEDKIELVGMNNVELHAYGTHKESVTPLENELLHRLENYIDIYGDFIDVGQLEV